MGDEEGWMMPAIQESFDVCLNGLPLRLGQVVEASGRKKSPWEEVYSALMWWNGGRERA